MNDETRGVEVCDRAQGVSVEQNKWKGRGDDVVKLQLTQLKHANTGLARPGSLPLSRCSSFLPLLPYPLPTPPPYPWLMPGLF